MPGVKVHNHVAVRDNMGRFIADIEGAATKVVEDAITAGENAARTAAPERTGRLKASIQGLVVSRTQAVLGSDLDYAIYQDQGTAPHDMPANVTFWWEKAGRMWLPPDVYQRLTGYPGNDPINHPGNPAVGFFADGYRAAKAAAKRAIHRYYP